MPRDREPPLRRFAELVRPLIGARRAWRAMSLYPPYLGAGIRVIPLDDTASTFDVEMKLTAWNRNYFGTHFGGSLYSMCDPFFVLILAENLGRAFSVWDKAATIRFRRAGRGTVRARFQVPPERIEEIRRAVEAQGKAEPTFAVEVRDESGAVVCEIEKLLHVTRRRETPRPRR